MPRPSVCRKILNPPIMSGFKPFGMPLCELEIIKLHFDEYESLKLVNYENLPQETAADRMGISRPTFTRLYNKALKKITLAFVEGKAIEIEGGNVSFDSNWYKCKKCFKLIKGIENHKKCEGCDTFGINELIKINNKSITKMKIAVPVTSNNQVDDHFGHCEFYSIFTISDENVITSTTTIPSVQGCGCKSNIASTLADDGVSIMLAGGIGGGAINVLLNAGIQVVRGCAGDATEIVNQYISGQLIDSGESCSQHETHHAEGSTHQCNH